MLTRYYRPSTFLLYRITKPTVVEISTIVLKYQPTWVCAYAWQTIIFSLKCPVLKYQYLYCVRLKFTEIHPAISLIAPYKVLPFNEIIIKCALYFFLHHLHFRHFHGLHEPHDKYSICTCTCFIWQLACFFMDFNQICSKNSLMYVLPVKQLLAKSKQLNIFKRSFYTVGWLFL